MRGPFLLNARERYHAVMRFEPGVRTLLWDFAYWTGAVERWYGEGLQRSTFAPPPGNPLGAGILAEGLPYPPAKGDVGYHRRRAGRQTAHDVETRGGTSRIAITWFPPTFRGRIILIIVTNSGNMSNDIPKSNIEGKL